MGVDWVKILPTFFASVASAWVITWLKNAAKNYKPVGVVSEAGEIRLNQKVAWFTLIIGLLIFNFSIFLIVFMDGGLIYGLPLVLLGLFCAIGILPALSQIQNLKWDNQTIEGPSKVYGQFMGIKRAEIAWSSIMEIGFQKGPYFFIETIQGTRIYWSPAYSGFEHFESTLKKRRPKLDWPNPESLF